MKNDLSNSGSPTQVVITLFPPIQLDTQIRALNAVNFLYRIGVVQEMRGAFAYPEEIEDWIDHGVPPDGLPKESVLLVRCVDGAREILSGLECGLCVLMNVLQELNRVQSWAHERTKVLAMQQQLRGFNEYLRQMDIDSDRISEWTATASMLAASVLEETITARRFKIEFESIQRA